MSVICCTLFCFLINFSFFSLLKAVGDPARLYGNIFSRGVI